ncbi:MAG: winged helix-turn-helix domain-containing protein [Deltaproteobacteria bacterium]|nr:winged helix-turn-helix domain-containing protein [Deltaproteobacteria bacterium]
MTRIKNIPKGAVKLADTIIKQQLPGSDLGKAICIAFAAKTNLKNAEISNVLNISPRTLFKYRDDFISRIENPDQIKNTWGGRRNFLMTKEDEEKFLSQFLKSAENGEITSLIPIRDALAKKLGFDVPYSTVSALLARNNWRLVEPDTRHPKSDENIQNDFKKNSRISRRKLHMERRNIKKSC